LTEKEIQQAKKAKEVKKKKKDKLIKEKMSNGYDRTLHDTEKRQCRECLRNLKITRFQQLHGGLGGKSTVCKECVKNGTEVRYR
jgi:superfamily II helicase